MPSLAARFGVSLAALHCSLHLDSLPLRPSAASANAPRAWAAPSWPSPTTRARSTGTRLASRWPVERDIRRSAHRGRRPTDGPSFFGAALPSLGVQLLPHSRYCSLRLAGRTDKRGIGRGTDPSLSTTQNFGVTLDQTVVNGLVIGSTLRLVNGGFEGQPGRTTVDLDAGAMVFGR